MIRPTKIKKTGEKELTIEWSDGVVCAYSTVSLRRNCPCATCRADQESKGSGYIPLFSGVSLKLTAVKPLGNYALLFVWGDGHDTGIYDYDYLRSLCPAETSTQV